MSPTVIMKMRDYLPHHPTAPQSRLAYRMLEYNVLPPEQCSRTGDLLRASANGRELSSHLARIRLWLTKMANLSIYLLRSKERNNLTIKRLALPLLKESLRVLRHIIIHPSCLYALYISQVINTQMHTDTSCVPSVLVDSTFHGH